MDTSNMKNIVVLKNLPSNIVEEAIVILKANKKVKKLETVEQSKSVKGNSSSKKDNGYILKEAEMIVNNYFSKMENKEKNKLKIQREKEKYKKVKIYAVVVTIMCILQFIVSLV